MTRSVVFFLALALGCISAAQACGANTGKHTKPDISRPAQPPAST